MAMRISRTEGVAQRIGQGWLLCALIGVTVASCRSTAPPTATSQAQRYNLQGRVVAFDKAKQEVTIAHEVIPGYMEAMTMPFSLYEKWVYDVLTPGATIQATLVVDGERSWIESPSVTQVADPAVNSDGSEPTGGMGPEPGSEIPDFRLVNQAGERIRLHQFRGEAVVLTFIYTRCPLPDYCPLMSRHFAKIHAALPPKARLLSVTLDPTYDTPAVLRDYGRGYLPPGEPLGRWVLATGSEEEVRAIAGYFGLAYWAESDQIIHGLRTAVISPEGTLVKLYRGNEWTPEEILSLLSPSR
jgi:protein SCO1/2